MSGVGAEMRPGRVPRPVVLAAFVLLTSCTRHAAELNWRLTIPDPAFDSNGIEASYFGEHRLEFADWTAAFLVSVGEPSLLPLQSDAEAEIYRLVLFQADRPPRLVRVDIDGDSLWVRLRWQTGILDPSQGPREVRESHFIAAESSGRLWMLLRELRVLELSPHDGAILAGPSLDGSTWVIEGLENGRYNVVSREAPDRCIFRSPQDIVQQQVRSWERTFEPRWATGVTPDREETVYEMAGGNVRVVAFVEELFRVLEVDDWEFEPCNALPVDRK